MCLGSGAGFLVLESETHAKARNAKTLFTIRDLSIQVSDRGSYLSNSSGLIEAAQTQIKALAEQSLCEQSAILSCSAGSGMLGEAEAVVLNSINCEAGKDLDIRSSTNFTGALLEAALPFGIALGCLCLERGKLMRPFATNSAIEKNADNDMALQSLLINCWGHYLGEANLILER